MVLRATLFTRLLILVAAATLPAVLVLVYLQFDLRRDRQTRLAEEALRHAELINADIGNVMQGARQLGVAISHFASVKRLDPSCGDDLRALAADLPGFGMISVRTRDARLICSAATAQRTPVELAMAPHVVAAMGHGELRAGLFVPASPGRGAVLPLCVAYTTADGLLGFVVLELSLDWLAAHVSSLRLPTGGTVGIADRAGTTLVRVPQQANAVGAKLPPGVLPLVGAAQPGNAMLTGFDGLPRLIGYVAAGQPGQGVFVSVGLSMPAMLADIDDAAWQGGLMIGLGAMLSLWLALLVGERFVRRPTAALLDAARRWSAGDLRSRADMAAVHGAEFHQLGVAFNGMAEALGRRRAELEELNATLEARVQARTRDLTQSAERLQVEIAERERTEAELRQAQKLQAVGQLAGGIAHDFNNLLTAIIGALDLLRRRLPAGERQLLPMIENALHAAERGGRLTSQLLAFSRRQRLLPVPTDLNVSVLALTGLLGSTLGRNIRVETDLSAELWPAMVDPSQVESMILNLAINARDAMEEGGVLTLQTRNLPHAQAHDEFAMAEPGDYVVVQVSDTGCGIAPEVMARVFEPFFTTKKLGAGAGLGLSQVHGLAVQSGGDVRIDSQPGMGTRVSVLLPRAMNLAGVVALSPDAGARTDQPVAGAHTDEATAGARRSGLNLLVVDDDRVVREMTGEMLAERGHATVLARDAAEALAILRSRRDGAAGAPFDVMLADYVMPGMNGVSLIVAAQALYPDLRALLVTGSADLGAADAIPPDDIMRKPFTIAQLDERLGRIVAQPSRHADPIGGG